MLFCGLFEHHHSLKWKPDIDVVIDRNKEDAVKCAHKAKEEVQIFTDSSGYNGGIGAVAILRRPGRIDKTLCYHLGSEKQYTVYNNKQVDSAGGRAAKKRRQHTLSVHGSGQAGSYTSSPFT